MSKFSNGFMDGYTAGLALRDERREALKEADKVIAQCGQSDAKGSDSAFIKQLSNYLGRRKYEIRLFSNNSAQIEKRSKFIGTLIHLITGKDIVAQQDALKEEKTRGFKGFFTQELYDILVARRAELEQRSNAGPYAPPAFIPTNVGNGR